MSSSHTPATLLSAPLKQLGDGSSLQLPQQLLAAHWQAQQQLLAHALLLLSSRAPPPQLQQQAARGMSQLPDWQQ